jgi:transposase
LSHEASETIRRLAVQRVKDGERPSDVIKSFGLCRTTIYKWLEADRGGGEEALKARKHPGPEPKLSPTQKLKVRKWINGKDPRQYGFDFGLWTRQIVADLVEEKFGIQIGVTAVGRLTFRTSNRQFPGNYRLRFFHDMNAVSETPSSAST